MEHQKTLALYGYVYLIRNRVNGKVYVGQTTQGVAGRWAQHKSNAKRTQDDLYLYRAIRKYGPESFDVVTLHRAFSRDELNEMEKRAIWSHESTDPECGYNMTEGGEGGTPSKEVRRRISVAKKGRKLSEDAVRKRSEAQRGRKRAPFSEEHRRKISEAMRGKKRTPHSEKTKHKMSEAAKGRKLSAETIRKRSEARRGKPAWNKGIPMSEAQKQKMSQIARNRSKRIAA